MLFGGLCYVLLRWGLLLVFVGGWVLVRAWVFVRGWGGDFKL